MVLLIRCLALLLAGSALVGCTQLLFHPMKAHVNDPEALGIEAEDMYFEATDGVRLHAWFLPAKAVTAKGTVLFLHGNAENISTHLASVWWLPDHGFNVLLLDYRGYGRSEGRPSLPGVHEDARAALDALRTRDDVDLQRIAVFGQSLGGAVAINLVAKAGREVPVRALVVEGVPSSFRTRAREVLGEWWLTWAIQWPLSLTISDRYRPLDSIDEVAPVPLLIVHGEADSVIPIEHGRRLYAAAREPKDLWLVPGAEHIAAFRGPEWRARLVRYLDEVMAAGADPRGPEDGPPRPPVSPTDAGSPSHSADPVQ